MDEAMVSYEFDGELFNSSGALLDALAHQYKVGDKELVITTLEDYGFDLADINV